MQSPHERPSFIVRYQVPGNEAVTIELGSQALVVGSAENADVRIAEKAVSRRHFLISLRNNQVYISDLNSHNGTYLKGLRLPSNLDHEWAAGDPLRITDIRFELIAQKPDSKRETVTLALNATPSRVRINQPVQLRVSYQGSQELAITLQAQPVRPGFTVAIVPNGGTLRPGESLAAEARIQQTKPFWLGGESRIRFSAISTTNQLDTAEVVVKTRFRYEILLLLLLLLIPPAVVLAVNAVPPPATPTLVAVVPSDTAIPSSTFTPTASPSASPTATLTTTATPVPICVKQCPSDWGSYIVQPGDTLFSLALTANQPMSYVQSVNCIASANNLLAGSSICLPIQVQPPRGYQQTDCTGFRPTSPFHFRQEVADFYWDAPTNFVPSSYHLEIYSTDTNQLLASRDVTDGTTTSVDVSWNSALGQHSNYVWRIQALLNGEVACFQDTYVQIDPPPTDTPPPPQPEPTPYVDLRVSSINVVGTPSWDNQCVQLTLSLSYTVRNAGNRSSGTFASQAFLYEDDSFSDYYDRQCGGNEPDCPERTLGPGQSTSIIFDTSYRSSESVASILYVVAQTDIDAEGEGGAQTCANQTYCNVRESIENNNSRTQTIAVPACSIATQEVTPEPVPLPEVTAAVTPDPSSGVDLVIHSLRSDISFDCAGNFVLNYSYGVSNYGYNFASKSYSVLETYSYTINSTTFSGSNSPIINSPELSWSSDTAAFSGSIPLDGYSDGSLTATVSVRVTLQDPLPDINSDNDSATVLVSLDTSPDCPLGDAS